MDSVFISFVVPVYNALKYLRRCVTSLQNQTYANIELVLVDDGSIDGSDELCDAIAQRDSRVVVVHQANQGVSVARNKGIEIAKGKYIAFVDADDWLDLNVCSVFAEIEKNENYDLFCFSAIYCAENKTKKAFLFEKDVDVLSGRQREELHCKVMAPKSPDYEYNCNTRFAGSAWGRFYRTEVLKTKCLKFSSKTIISEDVLFNILALDKFEKIGYTTKVFYHYWQSANSAQNRYRKNSMKYFEFLINEIQNWLLTTKKNQLYRDCANTLFVHYLFGALKEDYFHKDNPDKKIARLELCQILDKDEIRDILNNANYTYFSKVERMLVELLQKRKVRLIECLLKVYNALVRS